MKKTVVLLLVLLCSLSVFASRQSIIVKYAPMAFQISSSSEEPDYKVKSTGGMGAEIYYKRLLGNRSYAIGGFSWSKYSLPEYRPDFSSYTAFAGLGLDCYITKNTKLSTQVGGGVNADIYDDILSKMLCVKGGTGLYFSLTDGVEFSLSCDVFFSFPEKDGVNYINHRIIPMIGTTFNL